MSEPCLAVSNLNVEFRQRGSGLFAKPTIFHAVRDVSFAVERGMTLGLVGESGSGKTTTAMAAVRLREATSGSSVFAGKDLYQLNAQELRQLRCQMQVVFQDPFASLNPRRRIAAAVREPLDVMDTMPDGERDQQVQEMLETVGLRADQMSLFPHQFSGGQRQRIAIARALISRPSLLVCDEPVSALDVAIQAQLLNLFRDLREKLSLTMLFISHDLGVINYVCDRVAVMYAGEIVEEASRHDIFTSARHPYTKTLIDSAPSLLRRKSKGYKRLLARAGGGNAPSGNGGCSFAARCPQAQPLCHQQAPTLQADGERSFACHYPL